MRWRSLGARHGSALIVGGAAALCVLWVAAGLFGWGSGRGVLARLVPVALIVLAAGLGVALVRLRAEAATLRSALAAMRSTAEGEDATGTAPGHDRGAAARAPGEEGRSAAALSLDSLFSALQFPRDPEDAEGMTALRLARSHPRAGPVVQAAEDMMTLLAERGIYADDLVLADAPASAWRAQADRLADPARGAARHVASSLAAADGTVLQACHERMAEDTVFRDTALHFLVRFEAMLAELAPDLDDAALAELGRTRSARSYRLIATAEGRIRTPAA